MALIHGWPLNGGLQDKGTHSTPLLGGLTSYSDDGKIGKCLSGNTVYMPASETVLSLKDNSETICFGFNNGGITESGAICGTNGNYDGTDKDGTVSRTGDFFTYPTKNDFYGSMGAMGTGALTGVLKDNTWHHIAVVLASSNGRVYIDGVKKTTFGRDPNGAVPNFNQDFHIKCSESSHKINDFRIYDEALSDKEVKKISQELILHYNPDYAIRSSCGTGDLVDVSGQTVSTISDPSLPSGKYTKTTGTATGSGGGPYFTNIGPSANGATYTTSFYWKSKGYKPNLNCENYTSIKIYTTLAPNGGGYTQIVGIYNSSAPNYATTFYGNPPNGTACELDVSSTKIEPGDFATPYRRDNKSYIPDSSGFGHDGTIISEAIEKSTDHRYKKNIVADGNPEHYIQSNINPSFLTSGVTFNVWYKNITNRTFLIANGQDIYHYVMAMNDTDKGCGTGMSGEQTYYIDGQPRTVGDGYPKDGQGHMYTFVGTNIETGTALYGSRHSDAFGNYNGPLGDIRLYATALSAADVKALYNETRVTHPMQFLISNSSALSSMTSSNPVLADGELVVVRSTDGGGKTCFNIRKGNGVSNFNSLPWKQISETLLKGWRSSFTSDGTALTADTNSYSQLGGGANR